MGPFFDILAYDFFHLATHLINGISEAHNDLDDLPTLHRKISPWQIHDGEMVF